MRHFQLEVRFPAGSILVGGYSATPKWIDAIHAADQADRPIIPATALRGALRESLEAVLRGNHLPACQGGTGQMPGTTNAKPVPCQLDQGKPCVACRLFGLQRGTLHSGERFFSALILGAASLGDDESVRWQHSPHVSISRSSRSAEDERLFNYRVPCLIDQKMMACGYLLDDGLHKELEASVRATTHIGGGRSRGQARVDLTLHWSEGTEATPPVPPSDQDAWVRLTLKSPAAIGSQTVDNNVRDSRAEIPGAMLRGAIGFALAKGLVDPDHDRALQSLVAADTGAQFGFLFPTTNDEAQGKSCAPWPITAKACKFEPTKHPVVDTVFERIAVALLQTPAQARQLNQRVHMKCAEPGCNGPLRGAKGNRSTFRRTDVRLITRVALDRDTGSAADGKLFSQVLVESGTRFEGAIRNVPPQSQALLASAAAQPLFIGRGTSAGWGQATLEFLSPPSGKSLTDRGEYFREQLHEFLHAVGVSTDKIERYVPVTLLSPLWPSNAQSDEQTIEQALGGKVTRWVCKARRFAIDGGWDQRAGELFTGQVVAAGAVFVAELSSPWPECLAELQACERHGVGLRRHQGFGQLICFDSLSASKG